MPAKSCFLLALVLSLVAVPLRSEDLLLELTRQEETATDSGRFHRVKRTAAWDPTRTALIVCDVWDLHHCKNAVDRVGEFAPRLNQVIKRARNLGVTVIHAPSDCMPAYVGHPARIRAETVATDSEPPALAAQWCLRIPSEEAAVYPIDQSDGGEDDDPQEHAKWVAHLESLGRNPGTPWKTQTELVEIDEHLDYISDRGDEVWRILRSRGIENVILTGVHTNMCVLGRPFGLRRMVEHGHNVVLMRDMTDTMYNPHRWPYVSHFTGTDLVINHIERYVCPTITSDQFVGGKPFRFKNDNRPHLVMLIAEDEYETNQTLPPLAVSQFGKHFRVSIVHGSETERNQLPGLEVIKQADVLLVSIRRRVLPDEQMQWIKDRVADGIPVIGIRTASHAFALRNETPPDGYGDWPEFDAEVFGGNYHNHYGNKLMSMVRIVDEGQRHPILNGVSPNSFRQGGSLYKTSPVADGAQVLAIGTVEGHPEEPVAWTFRRADGGKSFYTSMGHVDDFNNPAFLRMLTNAVYWAADLPIPDDEPDSGDTLARHWTTTAVPATWQEAFRGLLADFRGPGWYRCVVHIPASFYDEGSLSLTVPEMNDELSIWLNGSRLESTSQERTWSVPEGAVIADDANLLVIRVDGDSDARGLTAGPVLNGKSKQIRLAGTWQFRIGVEENYSNMPLPARFGASTDIVFEASEE